MLEVSSTCSWTRSWTVEEEYLLRRCLNTKEGRFASAVRRRITVFWQKHTRSEKKCNIKKGLLKHCMEYKMDFIFVKNRFEKMSAATTAMNNAILYIADWLQYLKVEKVERKKRLASYPWWWLYLYFLWDSCLSITLYSQG